MNDCQLDQVLAEVARQAPESTDALLDLREAVLGRRDPGTCVKCFFNIHDRGEAPDHQGATARLRTWLEARLEIVARDERNRELERLPVNLEGESLEGFCHRLIREFRENRVYASRRIDLEFRFRSEAA
ncbi:MAG: hypothetical protein ACFE0O_12655 [Opitutales bacterium]